MYALARLRDLEEAVYGNQEHADVPFARQVIGMDDAHIRALAPKRVRGLGQKVIDLATVISLLGDE